MDVAAGGHPPTFVELEKKTEPLGETLGVGSAEA